MKRNIVAKRKLFAVSVLALLFVGMFGGLGVWQIKPAQAAYVFSDGFEDGTTDAWNLVSHVDVVTSPVHTGTYAAHRTLNYDTCKLQVEINIAGQDNFLFYVNLSDVTGTYNSVAYVQDGNADMVWWLYINSTTVKLHRYFPAEADLTASFTFSSNTWYELEVQAVKSATVGEYRVFVDGSEEITETGLDTSGMATYFHYHQLRYGAETETDMTWDDVVIDNARIGGGDTTVPTFGTISANTTLAGNGTQISCTINDETALSTWGFAWNNTGVAVNASKIIVSGGSVTALYNGTWNGTVGNKVWVQFWANDTTGNEAYSSIQTFTLTTSTGFTEGDGEASDWTYRISQNSTACYLINSTGIIWDSGTPDDIIYWALENCSLGGSIYVYPATYNMTDALGCIAEDWTDLYLCFGPDTVINRTSGSGWPYVVSIKSTASGMHNVTVTSNGTAYFEANNLVSGLVIDGNFNCTYQNLTFEHMYSQGIYMRRSRYCAIENITVFSYDETEGGQSAFAVNDVQYSTFENIIIDGNYQPLQRVGFYMSDWEDNADWNGSYFNTIEGLWIKHNRGDGIYLNSGGNGYHVYNNTFTNCTIEDIWRSAQDAIKLRPAQNNTFTNIIIRNCTNAVTTGTSELGEANGNCTGNSVQAYIYNCTEASLILTTDGVDQEVSGNFFNLTIEGGIGQTYFYGGTNSPIFNNIVHANFTDCHGAIILEMGIMYQNTFYLNFSGVTDHPDIGHVSSWTTITNNTFRVYATSGNPNGLMDFTNGTQQNFVFYPYVSGAPPSVSVFIVFPTNTTYTSSTVSVELYASGGTIDTILWNCTFTNGTVAYANTVYTVATSMTLGNGSYIFNARANNTDGDWDEATVMFTVQIPATPPPPPPSGERKTTIWVEPEYVNTTLEADKFILWCLDHYITQIAIHGDISDTNRAYLTSYGFPVFQTIVCTLDPPADYNYSDYMNSILNTYANYSGIIFNDGQTLWDKARAANLTHEEALENYQSFITYAEQILTPHYGMDNVINIACIFSDSIDYILMPQINATQSVFTYYYPPDPTIRYFSNYTWFNTTASGWDVKSFYEVYAPSNCYQYEGWMLIYVPNIPTDSILKTFNGILDLNQTYAVENIEIFQYSSIANDTKYSRLLKYLCKMWTEGVSDPILSDAVYVYNWTETYWQELFNLLPANQSTVTYEGWQFTQSNSNFTYAVSDGRFVLFWNGSRSEAGWGSFLMQRAFTTELGLNMSVEFMPIADMISKSIIITEGEAFDSLQAYRFGFSAFTYDMNFIFFNVSRQETTIDLGKWTPYSSYTIQFNIDMVGCTVKIENSTWTWTYTIPSSQFRYNSVNTRTLLVQATIGNLSDTNAVAWTMDFTNANSLTLWNPPFEFLNYTAYSQDGFYVFLEDGLLANWTYNPIALSANMYLYGRNTSYLVLGCDEPSLVQGDVLSHSWSSNELTVTILAGSATHVTIQWQAEFPPSVPLLPAPSEITNFVQYLLAGDFLGFIVAIYTQSFGSVDIFFGVVIMLVMVPLYIRTKSLMFMSILWILLGSLFLVALPLVSGLAVLLLVLGIGSMLFELFMINRRG